MPVGAPPAAHHYVQRLPPSSILFFVFLISAHLAAAGQMDDSIQALLKFKSSLVNVEDALSSWNASVVPCSGNQPKWRGVLCYNGYVWGLQLENMSLKGQIDVDSLTPLSLLRTLSFMNNNFAGPMPDWRKLGPLKSLFLSNNEFAGEMADDDFNGMASLKKVYMANNKFTGHIPSSLAYSPRLLELRLENNQFIGGIPEFKPDLRLINVSNNQLEGPIPSNLGKMDPSSFAGNKNLCGKPLESECPLDMEPPTDPSEKKPSSSSSSSSATTAIIIAVIVAVVLIVIILFILIYRRKQNQTPQLGRTVSPGYNESTTSDAKAVVAAESAVPVAAAATAAAGAAGNQETSSAAKTSRGNKGDPAGKLTFAREDRQKFDLQDLMRASAEVLGSGNFGASYKAVLVDGEALVVKRFKQMNNVAREDFHEHMRRLGRLDHPNLLPLVAYLYRKEEKLLVFDYVSNGSLAGHLHGKHSAELPGLSWPTRLKIIKGVCKGLLYLHNELSSLSLPHGHLKSSNVLLDDNLRPLLMDYTLVPVVNPSQVQQLLVAYKSPEYAQQGRTTKKTDVWCLGILILETLTGKFVTKYLTQGTTYGAELAGWVNAICVGDEDVFDKEMGNIEQSRGEIMKLLEIGKACCEEDLDKRWDLEEVAQRVEQIKEMDF